MLPAGLPATTGWQPVLPDHSAPRRVSFGLSFVSRTSQPRAEIWSRSSSLRFQFFSRLAFSRSFASCATSVGIMISTSASRSRTVLIRFHQSSDALAEAASSLFSSMARFVSRIDSNKNPSAAEMFRSSSSEFSKSDFSIGLWALDVFFLPDFAQPCQPFIDATERFSRLMHSLPCKIERHAIVHAQERVTKLAPGVTFRQNIWDRVKIAQRFRHFLAIDQQVRAMQPIADEFLACHAFALCDLCFVMRKNVIDAATMNIDLVAE